MTILFALLACGGADALDQPNPPPPPPPILALAEKDIITLEGTAMDLHAPTRTWVLATPERRQVCFLVANALMQLDGKPALVSDLPEGATVTAEGRLDGDLLLVQRAVVKAVPAPAAPDPAAEPPLPATP